MISPRFLDTVDISVRQTSPGTLSPEVATTFSDPRTVSGAGLSMRTAQEQVKNYKYWVYVAIRRTADFASSIRPNFSVPVSRSSGQAFSIHQRDREHLRQRYGMFQTVRDDLEPLPDGHPLCTLFQHINPEDSYCEFIYETFLFWLLTGRFYWWVIPNGLGRPTEMWVIPTQSAEELYNDNGTLRAVRIRETQKKIPAEQIIRGKFKSPLNKRDSYSEMQAAPLWINNVESIAKSQHRTFEQGVNPDLIMHLESDRYANPTEDEITAIKEKFLRRSAGVEHSGEPLLVPPGVKMEKWSRTAREMDYDKGSDQMRDQNLALYGVPKTVAGIIQDVNRAAFEGSMVAFCNIRINPLMAQLAGIITEKLAPFFDHRIVTWFPDCTPTNVERELAEDTIDLANGAMTPDERRSKRGRDPEGTPAMTQGYIGAGRVPINDVLDTGGSGHLNEEDGDDS